MFERYTEAARRAIFAARYHAGESDSASIETEHLLLGLADADGARLRRLLGSADVVDGLCKELRPTSVRPHVSSVDLPLTHESKRVLAYGAEEGYRLRHEHLGPEHLLLGLLREKNCRAARLLRERATHPGTSPKRPGEAMKSKTPWREKMNRPAKVVEILPGMQKRFGRGKMLIPCPMDVDALMRTVRRGRLVTQSQIREQLARAHKVDVTCPITTGIFVRLAAEAAEEDLRLGKKRITPYWRVVRDDGSLNPKLKRQGAHLLDEGYVIEPGARKNSLRVRDFAEHLAAL